jgi:hypothetical protein
MIVSGIKPSRWRVDLTTSYRNEREREMNRKASSYQRVSMSIAAGGAALALLAQAAPASAEEVSATGKGITGGALLGGEVVMLVEAAAGLRTGWVYVIGGVVGAGGGAVAGWQIEKNADSKVSLYMLAGGMALVIPTIVAVLQASSYKAPEEYTEDRPSSGQPVPEPPRPGATPATSGPSTLHYHWQPAKLKLPAGLLDLDQGAFKVAVPAVEIRPTYGLTELQKFGLEQKHELRVPVFSATF